MRPNPSPKPELVTDEAKVTGCDGLPVLNWRRFWLVEKPAETRHYPSPVTNPDCGALPKPQVLAPPEPASTYGQERVRIFAAFPEAKALVSGCWRLCSTRYSHNEILADADAMLAALLAERAERGDLAEGADLDALAATIRREARERHEREQARIRSVFPQAAMLANGLLRIDAGDGHRLQHYDHDNALLLATQAHARDGPDESPPEPDPARQAQPALFDVPVLPSYAL